MGASNPRAALIRVVKWRGGACIVVVCTNLSGKEPHRQAGIGKVVTSGSLGDVMVSTLAQNARGVGSIPALGTIFPIFITSTTLSYI